MKNSILMKGLAGLLLMALFAAGCNKEEENPPPPSQALSFNADEVLAMVPAGLRNSQDEYAQDCYDFIESAVDMSGFISNMEVPDGAIKTSKKSAMGGDTWKWTWSYAGESFTFYWTYDEDNSKRYWTMDIQFGSGPRYDYIDAWETKDGKQGEVVFNYGWAAIYSGEPVEDYDFVYWRYTWTLDSSGAYHINFYWDSNDPEYEMLAHYDLLLRADGSGTIDYYFYDELFYHMEWNTVGDGSWAYYIDGEVYMSGTWAAG
jgi:hypothetical protein